MPARVLAEFAERRPPDSFQAARSDQISSIGRWAPDEVGLALRLARGSAAARVGQSVQLVGGLPGTLALWKQGHLDLPRVQVTTDATAHLTPEQARQVEERVLGRAGGQTRGQLSAAVVRAVAAVDPDGADRHKRAQRERRAGVSAERDGMASLWASLAAPDAVASFEWLSRLARSLEAEDGRGMDARRAAGGRHDHRLKDAPGWQVVLGADRSLSWTTPTGHRYTSTPHDYRRNNPPPAPANNADRHTAPGPRGDLHGMLHGTVTADPTDEAGECPF